MSLSCQWVKGNIWIADSNIPLSLAPPGNLSSQTHRTSSSANWFQITEASPVYVQAPKSKIKNTFLVIEARHLRIDIARPHMRLSRVWTGVNPPNKHFEGQCFFGALLYTVAKPHISRPFFPMIPALLWLSQWDFDAMRRKPPRVSLARCNELGIGISMCWFEGKSEKTWENYCVFPSSNCGKRWFSLTHDGCGGPPK